MGRDYYDSELIEDHYDGLPPTSAFVAEGPNGWVVAYNGNAQLGEGWEATDAFNCLQDLRKRASVPEEHRPHLKNLARRLFAHIKAQQGVTA